MNHEVIDMMKQSRLARCLRALTVLGWCACGVLAFFVVPLMVEEAARMEPTLAWLQWPGLTCFWAAMVPVVLALWHAWKIFGEIGRDNSFCLENARRLRVISRLALGDTAACLIALVALLCLGAMSPGLFLLLLAVTGMGAAIAVAAAALSHLTRKAADIQDENDLTI